MPTTPPVATEPTWDDTSPAEPTWDETKPLVPPKPAPSLLKLDPGTLQSLDWKQTHPGEVMGPFGPYEAGPGAVPRFSPEQLKAMEPFARAIEATGLPDLAAQAGKELYGAGQVAVDTLSKLYRAASSGDPIGEVPKALEPAEQYAGAALRKAGELTYGLPADLISGPSRDPETGESQYNVLPIGTKAPAYFTGEEMPFHKQAEQVTKELGPTLGGFVKTIQGLVESVPQMGAQAALGPAVGPAVWGLNEQGFSPSQAATMYALGPLSKWSGAIAEDAASRLGVRSDLIGAGVNKLVGAASSAGFLTAKDYLDLAGLSEAERKEKLPQVVGNSIAMFLMALPHAQRAQLESTQARNAFLGRLARLR